MVLRCSGLPVPTPQLRDGAFVDDLKREIPPSVRNFRCETRDAEIGRSMRVRKNNGDGLCHTAEDLIR